MKYNHNSLNNQKEYGNFHKYAMTANNWNFV